MKRVNVCEFKDLSEDIQKKVLEQFINEEIEMQLDFLNNDLTIGTISEEKYWQIIGCTKYYGESTSWFVPAVYYENHKEQVDKDIQKRCKYSLFDRNGKNIEL